MFLCTNCRRRGTSSFHLSTRSSDVGTSSSCVRCFDSHPRAIARYLRFQLRDARFGARYAGFGARHPRCRLRSGHTSIVVRARHPRCCINIFIFICTCSTNRFAPFRFRRLRARGRPGRHDVHDVRVRKQLVAMMSTTCGIQITGLRSVSEQDLVLRPRHDVDDVHVERHGHTSLEAVRVRKQLTQIIENCE